MSALEDYYSLTLTARSLPVPCRELKFDPVRKWRVDFAWVALKLAVEIEGGAYTGGRHTRGAGFEADCEKYNALALAGWTLLRFTRAHVESGAAADFTERMIYQLEGKDHD